MTRLTPWKGLQPAFHCRRWYVPVWMHPLQRKKEEHSAKRCWIPFSRKLTNANFIRVIKSWRTRSGKSQGKLIFRKKTKSFGMYTSVLVKYVHIAVWSQQVIQCSRYTPGWFVCIRGSGTPYPCDNRKIHFLISLSVVHLHRRLFWDETLMNVRGLGWISLFLFRAI